MHPVFRIVRSVLLICTLAISAGCRQAPPPAVGGYPDFADLVERVSPVVVNISTLPAEPTADDDAQPPPETLDPEALEEAPEWFRRFFDQQQPDGTDDGIYPPEQQSLGSGFILWDDGYILTNFHVVRGAREVVVRLLDRRQFTAQIVGSDEASDLALLKIDATELPVAVLGNSDRLRPGQWVLAIGSPFGFDYSVTAGIVSAKGRALETEQYVPFIQTDVAINPGNSGGPLFNLTGEVVGVNSQIYSQSGGYQGVSFSIPIDVAAKVARQLRDTGVVTRGWLGVVVQEVDRDLAMQLGLDKPEGALVARVLPDSPASRAGIKEGDVILDYDGAPLPSSSTLPHRVGITDPGQTAEIKVMRSGKMLKLTIEVGTLRPEIASAEVQPAPPAAAASSGTALGMSVRPLSADERRDAQVLAGGLLVTEVPDGAAARAGIRPGDILLQLAGQEVDSRARFDEVVDRLIPGQTIPVLVQRGRAPRFMTLDVPSAAVQPEPLPDRVP
jgi:serine protease Do